MPPLLDHFGDVTKAKCRCGGAVMRGVMLSRRVVKFNLLTSDRFSRWGEEERGEREDGHILQALILNSETSRVIIFSLSPIGSASL